MLGAAAVQILAIVGTSSAEPKHVLRYPRAVVGESGYCFDLCLGIPQIVICGPCPTLHVPGAVNLIEVGKT